MPNMLTIREPARALRVTDNYDVVVVGGGIAGVAAAVAAAREGSSVCVVEKTSGLGGLATLGIVTVWLPICDGNGNQVIGGIGEELLRLSVAELRTDNHDAGFRKIPACWQDGGDTRERKNARFMASFNPGLYTIALEEFVLKNGVDILYDTRLCDVKRLRGKISHIIVENKSGRSAIACSALVDASGDADLCQMAGEETESSSANVAAAWFYYLKEGKAHLSLTSNAFRADMDEAKLSCRGYDGTDARQVTAQLIESRQLIRRDAKALAAQFPQGEIEPFMIPSIPCLRATRRLVAEQSLGEGDMHRWFDDTVGLTGDWRRKGPVFAITLRMLRAVANSNLLSAGRCMSADKTIWDATRVIPTCAITGEAAGLAAAIAAKKHNGNLRRICLRELQQLMRAKGNFLSERLVTEGGQKHT